MRLYAISLSFVLLAVLSLKAAAVTLLSSGVSSEKPIHSIIQSDPESSFAAARRISVKSAGMYELEMVPGISDALALEILKVRSAILKQGASQGCNAFTLARGVGSISAKRLCRYFYFDLNP